MVHESLAWRDGLADDPRDRERHDAQSQRKHAECGVAQRVVALAEAEVAQAGQQVRDDRGAGRTHHLREGTRVNVGDFGSTTPVSGRPSVGTPIYGTRGCSWANRVGQPEPEM